MTVSRAQIIQDLSVLIGADSIVTAADQLVLYGTDRTKHPANPLLVSKPNSTAAVASILRYCHDHGIAVVPSGGRTGLAGGAVAANQEIIISLDRINHIGEIDHIGRTITVEAGAITEAVQNTATAAGLQLPLDLAAKGSSHIGGNIATNAGGLKVIRYGMMRQHVLGLEVVLPNGTILDMNYALIKNNTGYDLKQLFIGSEGTLGVITKATLQLLPAQQHSSLALVTLSGINAALQLLAQLMSMRAPLSAFEIMSQATYQFMMTFGNVPNPLEEEAPLYCLIELDNATKDPAIKMPDLLEQLFSAGLIMDGVIANNSNEFKSLWKIREDISETINRFPHICKNDIALPLRALEQFFNELSSIKKTVDSRIKFILFGHLGDGNLHVNFVADEGINTESFAQITHVATAAVYLLVQKFKGSISAEHGIGLLKKDAIFYTRSNIEVDLMRKIKAVFDPQGIMNPAKIF